MTRGVVCVLALVSLSWSVWSATPRASAAPTLDDQVYAIAAELMCPVCGGQTVAESGSQLAEQMRGIIHERLRAGQSREEIIAYFVGQFGEGILAAPPRRGGGVALWLVPPIALGIGLIVLSRFIRRTKPPAGLSPAGREARAGPPPPPTPAEVERIRRDVRELD
ncbi:MAG: cytochrome c-type biogenesis protein [Armatimonadota bacterium]